MNKQSNTNQAVAITTLRLILGFTFLMQGYGKVFNIGVDNVYAGFFADTYKDLLPTFITKATANFTSYAELIGGAMLVIGFKRDIALYALAAVLVIVTFGHGLATPIWDMSNVMARLIPMIPLLLLPVEWDRWSIDQLRKKK